MTFLVTIRNETTIHPSVSNTVLVTRTDMRWRQEQVMKGIIGCVSVEAMMRTAKESV
jgi:hypothetical protein